MTESNDTHQKSSLILALVAALIVASFDRRWLAKPVTELIPPGSGLRLDTLSRIKARVMGAFLAAIELAMTPGRRPATPAPEVGSAIDDECARIKDVFAQKLKGKKRQAQDYVVGAFERLVAKTPVSQKLLCKKLGVPERSFRYWKKRLLEPTQPSVPPETKPEPIPRGKGRFNLSQTLPGIQRMADTTELTVGSTKLEIVAVQDPGNRHREIWSSYHVDVTENAQIVSDQLAQAPDGTQSITDNGTPYVAEHTRDTLDDKGCEPAPCTEYSPTEKATIERSNRTVKEAIAPLVEFFETLTKAHPALDCPALAAVFVQLVLDLFHHAYNLGHRDVPHPLQGRDPDVLDCIAEDQLEKARDGQRSRLATLRRIHDAYGLTIGIRAFVNAHRNRALADIRDAEQRLADAILSGTIIHNMHAYFAAILLRIATPRIAQRRRERFRRKKLALVREAEREQETWRDHLDSHSVEQLHLGLDLLAHQWRDDHFLFGEQIIFIDEISAAIAAMASSSPLSYQVDVLVEVERWDQEHDGDKPPLHVVRQVVEDLFDETERCAATAS